MPKRDLRISTARGRDFNFLLLSPALFTASGANRQADGETVRADPAAIALRLTSAMEGD